MDARGFEVDAEFEPPDDQSNMSINTTLTNGARYYLDHAHREFSTPGCTNARDIVRYEKAGDRVVEVSRARDEPHANRDTRLFPGDGAQEVPPVSSVPRVGSVPATSGGSPVTVGLGRSAVSPNTSSRTLWIVCVLRAVQGGATRRRRATTVRPAHGWYGGKSTS